MRFLYFLLLLAFAGAVGVFAYQNNEPITLKYLDRTLTSRLDLLIAAAYFAGMFSGWTVVGILRRSWQRVVERPQHG